ncbi:cobyric acid synthase [Microaerobacter geothermalis]|nr:cobyric acid synthase [Microaerobacter geothermalis]
MIQGTGSDVGKSVIVTALCRIFKQDGYRVAPFKSQNMSNNSYVTSDGKEIGRAQGVQAEAAGIEAIVEMNPILIKPSGDHHSQIVLMGRPLHTVNAVQYREEYFEIGKKAIIDSLHHLQQQVDFLVIEGAGSPAEINLNDRELVNMRVARWADAPVILVADIDRGGVFASIVGTLDLLHDEDKKRVAGVIINKFRGDLSLLQPGIEWLENYIQKPVLGVIPFLPSLEVEAEDGVVLERKGAPREYAGESIGIAVIRNPRISNFTDFYALELEPDVSVYYVSHPTQLGNPDAIILPGTKNTIEDLKWLRDSGLEDQILKAIKHRRVELVGICGGYQMLGELIQDPLNIESSMGEIIGFNLLPIVTTFHEIKRTVKIMGKTNSFPLWKDLSNQLVHGYEIHMGQSVYTKECNKPFLIIEEDGQTHFDGAVSEEGNVWGTYIHGIFDNDAFRRGWINRIRRKKGLAAVEIMVNTKERKEESFNRLADHVRSCLQMGKIYELIFS